MFTLKPHPLKKECQKKAGARLTSCWPHGLQPHLGAGAARWVSAHLVGCDGPSMTTSSGRVRMVTLIPGTATRPVPSLSAMVASPCHRLACPE